MLNIGMEIFANYATTYYKICSVLRYTAHAHHE